MIEIYTYNGEKIDRGPIWYIIFTTIIVFLVVYSFLKGGLMGGISIVFLFSVIIVSYVIMYLISMKKITIKVDDGFFLIGDKKYNFDDLLGFNIELDNDGNFTNFVIIPKNTSYPLKYKILSGYDDVKKFYTFLVQQGLPLYGNYENDRLYKIIKFLKLG